MRSSAQDRLAYSVVRSISALVQLGALICLTPLKQYGSDTERIIAFIMLSMMAWSLNVWCRRSPEYQRRRLARPVRADRGWQIAVSLLVGVFAVTAILYLQVVPTWPWFAVSLSLGGCTGYALTNA